MNKAKRSIAYTLAVLIGMFGLTALTYAIPRHSSHPTDCSELDGGSGKVTTSVVEQGLPLWFYKIATSNDSGCIVNGPADLVASQSYRQPTQTSSAEFRAGYMLGDAVIWSSVSFTVAWLIIHSTRRA